MVKTVFKMTMGLGLMVLAAQQVNAQSGRNCTARDTVLSKLAKDYGETRQGIGLGTQGSVVEIFASLQTGSWTITVTLPSGVTCLIAAGQSYEALSEALPATGRDT
ncbi:hypothetical protein [Primorskyibacter sp. S87]|uniref:hypothetical protein n=1 Tax=Primorskyibacter sp. S87 TaxID=3415126 RepID=UPI003C7B0D65